MEAKLETKNFNWPQFSRLCEFTCRAQHLKGSCKKSVELDSLNVG